MKKIFLLFLLVSGFSHAQIDSLSTIKLEEIELTSLKTKANLQRFPGAISRKEISAEDQKQQLSLQEYLTSIPGVISFNSSNFAQDLRLSIRGFGARSAFGIRGIKLVVDGIPETTPDGQGQLDNLPLGLLETIEVLRGPSALRYGNAAGGVVSIQTLSNVDKDFHRMGLRAGSFGFTQLNYTGGITNENTQLILHLNHAKAKGYRKHSQFENNLFNAKLKHQLNTRSKIVFQFNATNSPFAADAGGQTLEEFSGNRREARDRNITFNAGEKITHLKAGTSFSYEKNALSLQTYGFVSSRKFQGNLPFANGGWVELNRSYAGQGSLLTYAWPIGNIQSKTQLGYSFSFQNDRRDRFVNSNGLKGDLSLSQIERFTAFGAYLIEQLTYKRWTFNGGIRWDDNQLRVADRFLTDGNASDQRNLTAWSPQVGLSFQLKAKLVVYGNYSQSYETPTLSELSADPNNRGGFNDLINSQEARNNEIGLKYKGIKTQWNVAYFSIDTKNDLVPYELAAAPGRTFFRNTGATLRNGIEFDLAHQFNKQLTFSLSYSHTDFTYEEYESNGEQLDGNQLPGIPSSFGNVSIDYVFKNKSKLNYERIYRGELFTDDSNTTLVKGFWRDDISYKIPFKLGGTHTYLILGSTNLFNVKYSDNIRINAFGGRFYEAAPERSLYTALSIKF
ncbi:MAG: TonB-dependent receptor [Flavobacteriaceae bacterium]